MVKLNGNVERDSKYQHELKENGWKVITVWECETNLPDDKLYKRLWMELK